MKKPLLCWALIACVSVLSGCALMDRSEYIAPELSVPNQWSGEVHSEASSADAQASSRWWTQFNDSDLNQLIDHVLSVNSDLALATLTLQKARLEAGLSRNEALPELSGSLSSSYERELDSGDTDIEHATSLSLSYELDLWGHVAAAADAKQWAAVASFEDRESTAQSLAYTAASLYWEIGYLNQRLALTTQNIEGMNDVLALTQSMFSAGSATRLDVLESTQSLYGEQVTLSELQQQLSEAQNSLSILLNKPLQETAFRIHSLPLSSLPEIATGIPADLLQRRPDVRSALATLKASLADQDALNASYFPALTLTGTLSTSSSKLLELLQNPVLTLGSGLTLPFLEWKEMAFNKEIAALDYQMAVVDYRQTLYEAFEEVANLLAAKQSYRRQGTILAAQLTNAKEIERIYASNYKNGATDMLDWISAMESRRSKESTMLENKYAQFVNQAKIYQSLGGRDVAPEMEGPQ
jgi:NodT family efflux transporter outer membrane factor (OMF) lipoprotein